MAQCFFSVRLSLPPPRPPVSVPRHRSLSPSAQLDPSTPRTRVFVVSDLHTDYSENMAWVKSLSIPQNHDRDVLVVAGDVAETSVNFALTMSIFKEKFQRVFFVPGNHDLWLRREEKNHYLDSLDKLDKLLDTCWRLGVETKPSVVDDLGIIPLHSWYHESFDEERDITGIRIPSLEMACKDYHVCGWPDELGSGESDLAQYFDSLNEKNWNIVEDITRRCSRIISFSHFVPSWVNFSIHFVQEKSPGLISKSYVQKKRMLFYPNLPKIIGSKYLETRIRAVHGAEGRPSACHVFGHTHFCWDAILDGIRYVQAPLAYPRERKRRMNGGEDWLPLCIYADGDFAERPSPCYWSDYYSVNPRTPDNTELAPWVARLYGKG